ncbi:hypothetical protein Vafri_9294 [Volvox africanus]|uniref:DUF4219 domain-containing protein n=1 Tax=Volvox africanus TaxID=51714 RepID=A0A8J4B5F7_9CHLO|nr:hypothetical protein Vafri_9294 [Volvox africanus]
MGKTQLKEPLGAENYSIWKVRFTQLCIRKGIQGTLKEEPSDDDSKAKENDIKAQCIMAENVQDFLLKTVTMAKSAMHGGMGRSREALRRYNSATDVYIVGQLYEAEARGC